MYTVFKNRRVNDQEELSRGRCPAEKVHGNVRIPLHNGPYCEVLSTAQKSLQCNYERNEQILSTNIAFLPIIDELYKTSINYISKTMYTGNFLFITRTTHRIYITKHKDLRRLRNTYVNLKNGIFMQLK